MATNKNATENIENQTPEETEQTLEKKKRRQGLNSAMQRPAAAAVIALLTEKAELTWTELKASCGTDCSKTTFGRVLQGLVRNKRILLVGKRKLQNIYKIAPATAAKKGKRKTLKKSTKESALPVTSTAAVAAPLVPPVPPPAPTSTSLNGKVDTVPNAVPIIENPTSTLAGKVSVEPSVNAAYVAAAKPLQEQLAKLEELTGKDSEEIKKLDAEIAELVQKRKLLADPRDSRLESQKLLKAGIKALQDAFPGAAPATVKTTTEPTPSVPENAPGSGNPHDIDHIIANPHSTN